jgi:DNA polymerase III epsilon subunit-like protein
MLITLAEKQLSEIPVVVLDSETTGLSPGLRHRIVEVGAT